jgi:hypothetical protein
LWHLRAVSAIALFGGGLLGNLLQPALIPGRPGSNVQGGELGSLYYLSLFFFSLTTGFSFFYLSWDRKPQSWRRNTLYYLGTLILLAISGLNFSNIDAFALFTVIWLLHRLGMALAVSTELLSAIASMIGAVTGVLTYRQKSKERVPSRQVG